VPEPAITFLAARSLVRSILSVYGGLSPCSWLFETNAWGRPHIANPGVSPLLDFNLSHKPTCVTCLVGFGWEFGVDVEDASVDRPYLLEIADRFFSPSEVLDLNALPAGQQHRRFFELWTLKESYIKARGVGLSLGLSNFSFSVNGSSASVRFDEGFDDNAATWEFQLLRPDTRHLIATSVRRKAAPLVIQRFEASRLISEILA
jgi:4'-phosphopantetheinyl transferase